MCPAWLRFEKNQCLIAPHWQLPCLPLTIITLLSLVTLYLEFSKTNDIMFQIVNHRKKLQTLRSPPGPLCSLILVTLSTLCLELFSVCSQLSKCFLCVCWKWLPLNRKSSYVFYICPKLSLIFLLQGSIDSPLGTLLSPNSSHSSGNTGLGGRGFVVLAPHWPFPTLLFLSNQKSRF